MTKNRNLILCPDCHTVNDEEALSCSSCSRELRAEDLRILAPGTTVGRGRYILAGYAGSDQDSVIYHAKRQTGESVEVREFYPAEDAARLPMSPVLTAIRPSVRDDFEKRKNLFVREGNLLSMLGKIPGTLQVYEVFEENGTVYRAEDGKEGKTLEELLGTDGRMTFPEAMMVIEPVLETLKALHEKGFLHRDIKPSCILKTEEGICLTGFGSAGRIPNAVQGGFAAEKRHRTEGEADLSPYKAPEQVLETGPEGPWTDIYGAAAVLYRMVTGMIPADAAGRKRGTHLFSPAEIGTDVTEKESSVIMQGLSMEPDLRYGSAAVLLDALKKSMEADEAISSGQVIVKTDGAVNGQKADTAAVTDRSGGSEGNSTGSSGNRKKSIGIVIGTVCVLLVLFLMLRGLLFPAPSGQEDREDTLPASVSGNLQETENTETESEAEDQTEAAEQPVEEVSEEAAEEAVTIPLNLRILDSEDQALSHYSVRVTQDFPDRDSILIYKGMTDDFGWLETIELEDAESSYIEIVLQETGEGLYYPIEDIRSCNGSLEMNYSFHLYPVAYVFGGHTYALGHLGDSFGLDNYDDVKAYCEKLGGHLAVINNAEEDAFLYQLACVPGVSTAFFGYTDQNSEGDWVWAYGTSSYTNWTKPGGVHPGPDNGKGPAGWGPENYAEYNCGDEGANDGTWNDAKFAVNTSSFIIEWEFEKP